jgi:5,5'-dehydrodivanillate O-demethylase
MTAVVPPAPLTEALSPFETGPGTPAGRYLRSFWQPVSRSEDLLNGRAQPLTIMSEEFTLYRGETGTAVVTGPVCPHRLTRLSIGTVEGDSLRCRFHGWKFGPDGQCVEAPLQTASLVDRISIRTYPVREVHGLIFVYFGEGPEPQFPDIAGYSRDHGRDLTSARIVFNRVYRRYCNYYINTENTVDHAHVPYTHALSTNPTLTQVGLASDLAVVRDITVERSPHGVRVFDTEDGSPHANSAVLLPNVMHLQVGQRIGWLENLSWRVPIDDESHRTFSIEGLHTDEEGARRWAEKQAEVAHIVANYPLTEDCAAQIIRGEKSLMDFIDHPRLANIEDALTQQAMSSISDFARQNMAQSDKGVLQLRRMFMSRLADFVAGDPSATTGW